MLLNTTYVYGTWIVNRQKYRPRTIVIVNMQININKYAFYIVTLYMNSMAMLVYTNSGIFNIVRLYRCIYLFTHIFYTIYIFVRTKFVLVIHQATTYCYLIHNDIFVAVDRPVANKYA